MPLLLVACVRTTVIPVHPDAPALSPRAPSEVEVYFASDPARAYEAIAYFETIAPGGEANASLAAVLDDMKREAGRAGCDALIVRPMRATKPQAAQTRAVGSAIVAAISVAAIVSALTGGPVAQVSVGGSSMSSAPRAYRAQCIVFSPTE